MIKLGNNKQNNFLVGDTQVYSIYKGDTFIQGKEVERARNFEWLEGNNITINGDRSSYSAYVNYGYVYNNKTETATLPFRGGGNFSITYTFSVHGKNYWGNQAEFPYKTIRIEDTNGNNMSANYTVSNGTITVQNLPQGEYKVKMSANSGGWGTDSYRQDASINATCTYT